ncbi:MAG TPA: AMP-binding protein [Acidimicrobiales bacterium]|nr:AMP-binding protein [Acidimicrobiales bacterium]
MCNRLDWMQREYLLGPDDVVLQKTPASFDVSVWEFFWPLITGARLVLARAGGHKDSAYLRDLIVSEGVTTTHFVPSMLAVFLSETGVDSCTSLRRVICSGPAPTVVRSNEHELVEPGTPMERMVAEVWTEVLGVERLGIDDDSSTSADTRCWPPRWWPSCASDSTATAARSA